MAWQWPPGAAAGARELKAELQQARRTARGARRTADGKRNAGCQRSGCCGKGPRTRLRSTETQSELPAMQSRKGTPFPKFLALFALSGCVAATEASGQAARRLRGPWPFLRCRRGMSVQRLFYEVQLSASVMCRHMLKLAEPRLRRLTFRLRQRRCIGATQIGRDTMHNGRA